VEDSECDNDDNGNDGYDYESDSTGGVGDVHEDDDGVTMDL